MKRGSGVSLGARLATRYTPKQILPSTLSWGALIGVEEIKRLARCFASRSLTNDDDPTVTKEWLVHFIMEIIEEKANFAACSISLDGALSIEHQFPVLNGSNRKEFVREVDNWASSFSIRISAHDALWSACRVSNSELFKLQQEMVKESSVDSHSQLSGVVDSPNAECKLRKAQLRPKVSNTSTSQGSSISSCVQMKTTRQHELIRWSDLTTNFVCDYDHFHHLDDDNVSFTRVRGDASGERPTTAEEREKEMEGVWERVCKADANVDREAALRNEMHWQSADHVLLAPLGDFIITSSKDGFVKLWKASSGAFIRNLYNTGSSWVVGMYLLMDEGYMLIATTNNQLTLLEFPRGNIVQKYVGCDAVETTSCEVDQLSALDVQRYGMRPGECGAYRVQLQKNESAEAYHKRRREAQKDVLPKKIVAKFIIGFLGPITSWYEQQTGTFYFGTTDGKVGAFDIGTDIKSSTVLCSSNDRPIRLQFLVSVHAGVVMGMFYSSYAASLFTAGMDGRIYRISIAYSGEPVGDPRPIGHQMRAIRCMKWVPPSKHFITIHVNRRVVVWVIGRNSEPLWCFPPEAQEVLSASLHPRQHRLAVLLSDKTIKVYETHGKKSIATIQQTSTDTTRGVADPMRETAPLSEGDDGVVMWHPYSTSLICALRTVVIYTPSRARDASSCDELPPQSTATPETGLTENKTSDGAADAVSGGYDTRETLASLGPRRADTHQSGIVATLVHKHSWLLHTFSENAWRVWDLETGALRQHVDVPSTVRMGNLSLQTASVASCSWSTTTQTRLVTGGQDCSVITWDPETHAPLEHECLVRDTSDQLDFDVSVISHQNYLIAWTARTCRVTRYFSGILLPNGVESSDSTVIRVPSLSSVTACCVARDVYLCIGTGDSVLYFYSIRGGSPLHESLLVGPHGDEKGAIIQLIYLNEQEQSLLLAVLDNGLLFTYAVVDRSVLGCARLFHRFECRIRKALYVPDVALLLCGDSKGRLTAYTLLGHNPVQIDVRHPPPQCFSILAASSEITSLDAFTRTYGKYVIVGSLDRQVRLFRLEDITCGGSHSTVSPPFSALTTPRATIGDTVTFVGRFGRDIWRLDDPSTYNNDKAILAETKDVNSSAVEALLEGIIRPHAGATGARLDASLCTEEESGGSFAKFRKGRRVSTPSICPVPAQAAQQSSSFFLTEPSMMQMDGNQNVNMSMSCGSTKYPHDVPMPQHSPLQQPTTETSETNRASLSQQSERAWTVTSSRQRRSSTKVFTVSPTSQISGSSNQATAGTFMQNPEEVSDSVPRRESASGEGYRLRARSFLVSMTTRLEKVRPEGYRKGAFEMRLSEVSSSIEVPDGDHHSSDAMRLVLETRARLAERMEEYRRRQEALNKKRKTSGMQILARAILPPVVIPQPNVRSVDAHPSNDVTAAALRKQVTWRF